MRGNIRPRLRYQLAHLELNDVPQVVVLLGLEPGLHLVLKHRIRPVLIEEFEVVKLRPEVDGKVDTGHELMRQGEQPPFEPVGESVHACFDDG